MRCVARNVQRWKWRLKPGQKRASSAEGKRGERGRPSSGKGRGRIGGDGVVVVMSTIARMELGTEWGEGRARRGAGEMREGVCAGSSPRAAWCVYVNGSTPHVLRLSETGARKSRAEAEAGRAGRAVEGQTGRLGCARRGEAKRGGLGEARSRLHEPARKQSVARLLQLCTRAPTTALLCSRPLQNKPRGVPEGECECVPCPGSPAVVGCAPTPNHSATHTSTGKASRAVVPLREAPPLLVLDARLVGPSGG